MSKEKRKKKNKNKSKQTKKKKQRIDIAEHQKKYYTLLKLLISIAKQ